MPKLRRLIACTALACSAAFGGPSIGLDYAGTIASIADDQFLASCGREIGNSFFRIGKHPDIRKPLFRVRLD